MPLKKIVEIDGIKIGENCSPYTIAEISGNHGGDYDRALEMVRAAARSGAQAVKLQTYTADTITLNSDREEFRINDQSSLWNNRKLYDLYHEAHTPWEWHKALFEQAKKEKISIFSSPFDLTAIEFLSELNAPCFKISSFECTDFQLLEAVAKKKKPIILSTGTASLQEVASAVELLERLGVNELILLVCVSIYPAPAGATRLGKIKSLKNLFGGIPIGLSDHSLGPAMPIAAIGAGADVIEKHFKLDDDMKTVDSEFSITESELKKMCTDLAYVGQAMNSEGSSYWDTPDKSSRKFRRSLYFTRDLKKGEVIKSTDIRSVRPGFGLETKYYQDVVGMKVAVDIKFSSPVSWDLIVGKDYL